MTIILTKSDNFAQTKTYSERFILSPLLADGPDAAKIKEIKKNIYQQTGLSERTLRRYLVKYRAAGFGVLKPKGEGRPTEKAIPPQI